MKVPPCSTWLEIDLDNLRANTIRLREASGTALMTVVKANAYGHGAVPVARAAIDAGAAWCGVARVEEAIGLRRGEVQTPILVLGYTPPDQVVEALSHAISLTIFDLELAREYGQRAATAGGLVKVHLKVDTGMGRLGVRPEDAVGCLRKLLKLPGIEVQGLFTHFARADEPERPETLEQLSRFNDLLADIDRTGLRPELIHAANSAGTLNFPMARFDLVRCGIALYGLEPGPQSPLPSGFKPVLSWKARLASRKKLPAGHGISYGHAYRTARPSLVGVLPVGYADGFRRTNGNRALVGGRTVAVIGNVTMDQSMVQLDEVPDVGLQEEVVLIGRQGEAVIRAEDLARSWGTIAYEVVCGLAARLPRYYVESGKLTHRISE